MEKLNYEAKDIATKLKIEDRVTTLARTEAYYTIKDHKKDFRTRPSYRLINPAKHELGKVSKQILERINREVRSSMKVNQWQSTKQALAWFKEIENMETKSFT